MNWMDAEAVEEAAEEAGILPFYVATLRSWIPRNMG